MSRAKRHGTPYLFADLGMTEGESPTDAELELIVEAMDRKRTRCRVVPWDEALDKTLAGLDRYVADREALRMPVEYAHR